MKKSRSTDAQILAVLKHGENGVPVADRCRFATAHAVTDRSDGQIPPALTATLARLGQPPKRLGIILSTKQDSGWLGKSPLPLWIRSKSVWETVN